MRIRDWSSDVCSSELYIGAHAVRALTSRGRNVIVLDDLSTGNAQVIPSGVPLVVGDAGDRHLVDNILTEYRVSAVLHFAGSIIVPESVRLPLAYYINNPANSLRLLDACVRRQIGRAHV